MDFSKVSAHAFSPATTIKPLLVCFSHLRWNFVWQRPQQILSRAAGDYHVLFYEDPILAPIDRPRLEISNKVGAVTVAVPVVPQGSTAAGINIARRRLLDEMIEAMSAPVTVAWYYTPMALEVSAHLKPRVCVYDCMDELSAFLGAPRPLRRLEHELFRRADVVFTGGRSLYEAKRGKHHNVHCFPSSIDAAHFGQARKIGHAPDDQKFISAPRIGFFGVIDERLDAALLDALAEAKPEWQFVMIGPVVKIDPAGLPRRPNIHWLGPKSYAELPAYLAGWDAGFMPFAINAATRFISPTKTPEFLAAGVPLVSTPIRDVVRSYGKDGLVEIAGRVGEMAEKVQMLMERPRDGWLRRVDYRLRTTSWDATWRGMNRHIETMLEDRPAAGRIIQGSERAIANEVSGV